MKTLFKVLLFILIALLLNQCEWFRKDGPNDPVDFPDTAFLYALIEEGVDANGDSLISYAEVAATVSLRIPLNFYTGISDLTGIEEFVNLESLLVHGGSLKSINLSKNTALTSLSYTSNQLTNLDVSNNTKLTELLCGGGITSLDLSKNPNLTILRIYPGQLASLDVSNNTNLERLSCRDNQLTSLDVTNNTALTSLSCPNNQIANLDFSNNTALTHLNCSNNQFTRLDLSNNTALKRIRLRDNPNLHKVRVWITPFPPEGVYVNTDDSPNVYFTTD